MASRAAPRAVTGLVVAGLLAACTGTPAPAPSETPSPTPSEQPDDLTRAGDRLAVVVPPADVVARAEGAELARAAAELADDPPEGIARVRVAEAVSEAFTLDLAELAADDGYDIVCIVGTGSAPLALEFARSRRDVRVCTTDGRIEGGPVNLVAVAVDPAALAEAGAIAIGTAPAPVGLLLSPQLGDVEDVTATFTAAVAPPAQPSPPPSTPDDTPSPTASPSPPGPTAPQPPFVTATAGAGPASQLVAGEELAAQRPSRVLVLATPAGYEATTAATANGAVAVGVVDWLVDDEGELPANLLVQLTVDWAVLLTAAVEAALADEPVQLELHGVGLLGALPGTAAGAVPAADRTTAFLGQQEQQEEEA